MKYNNINSQLDETVMILLIISISFIPQAVNTA